MDRAVAFIGICKKAGKLEIGEEPAGAACRSRKARLLMTASDAADNTKRRAEAFGRHDNVLLVPLPFTKDELGRVLGRTSCAVLALTDRGMAENLLELLHSLDPVRYGRTKEAFAKKTAKPPRDQRKARRERNINSANKGE